MPLHYHDVVPELERLTGDCYRLSLFHVNLRLEFPTGPRPKTPLTPAPSLPLGISIYRALKALNGMPIPSPNSSVIFP